MICLTKFPSSAKEVSSAVKRQEGTEPKSEITCQKGVNNRGK